MYRVERIGDLELADIHNKLFGSNTAVATARLRASEGTLGASTAYGLLLSPRVPRPACVEQVQTLQ